MSVLGYLVVLMEGALMSPLNIDEILKGGLMQDLGTVMEQGGISITVPPLGLVLGGHIYIPLLPPLPLLPVLIAP